MKRVLSVLMVLLFLLGSLQSAAVAVGLPLRVVVNNSEVYFLKAKPMMYNGVMYAPVELFKDSLDIPVTQKDLNVELKVKDIKISFSAGEGHVYLNDVKTAITKPTYLQEDGTIFVPLGIFCELLGMKYTWDEAVITSYIKWDKNTNKFEEPDALPTHQKLSAATAQKYSEENINRLALNNVISTGNALYFTTFYSLKKSTLSRYDVKTKQTKVIVTDKGIGSISLVGNDLYYLGDAKDNAFHDAETFYRVKLDGTGKTKLSPANMTRYYVIDDGWFYFGNYNDQQKLYKMKLDGTRLTKVSDNQVDHEISVWGDYLVFQEWPNRMVFVSKTSGKVLANYRSTRGHLFAVYEDTLYLAAFKKGVEKVSLKNTVVKKETDMMGIGSSLRAFNISGDTLYYSTEADANSNIAKINSIKTDGTKAKLFLNGPKGYYIEDISIVGPMMYYTAAKSSDRYIVARSLYSVSLSNPAKSVLISHNAVN